MVYTANIVRLHFISKYRDWEQLSNDDFGGRAAADFGDVAVEVVIKQFVEPQGVGVDCAVNTAELVIGDKTVENGLRRILRSGQRQTTNICRSQNEQSFMPG